MEVARDLLGQLIIRDEVVLRIVETEAYVGPDDSACHARHGRTARNASMWGPPGRAYVYVCYGMHQMLNFVTGPEGCGAAVLIRGCAPGGGLDVIRARRGGRDGPSLLNGPGKVGQALDLDPSWSHHPLWEVGGLEVRRGEPPEHCVSSPRIGIDYASPEHRDAPWRFSVADNRWVSSPRPRPSVRG